MSRLDTGDIRHWSTANVPQASRLEYFASALTEAVAPFAIDDADPRQFHAELRYADLDAIGVIKTMGSAHRSSRGSQELARTTDHSFNLLMLLDSAWTIDHRGAVRLLPRDILIHDTRYPLVTDIRQSFTLINVGVTEAWLRHWMPTPSVLSTRKLSGQSPWGRALSAFLAGLSPELVKAPPLPLNVLSDQVGSLLALTARGFGISERSDFRPAVRDLHERILDCLRQRCTEPQLTAADVAVAVNVSLRTLHRTFAAASETFGEQLIQARVHVAARMLASSLFNRVTTSEIGRRAGFTSASHFARVIRAHTGHTPLRLRHSEARQATVAPASEERCAPPEPSLIRS
jgi:AraC-like DNA-binding protein